MLRKWLDNLLDIPALRSEVSILQAQQRDRLFLLEKENTAIKEQNKQMLDFILKLRDREPTNHANMNMKVQARKLVDSLTMQAFQQENANAS